MQKNTTYKVDASVNGLKPDEVLRLRKEYGENVITRQKRKSFIRQYAASFGDPVIKVLLIVLAINLLFLFRDSDWFESVGIALSIFLATFVSTCSEYGSESAFIKLQEDAQKIQCRVKRSDGIKEVMLNEIVTEDLVLLQAGERIPADGVLIQGKLNVDQSPLNGESKEAVKTPGNNEIIKWDLSIKNQLFHGCTVTSGEGLMRVVSVGDTTIYGHMAKQMQEETRESPLKIRLEALTKVISRIGYIAAFVIAIAYLFNAIFVDYHFNFNEIKEAVTDVPLILSHLLHAVTLATTVIVVSVPEGLPMMITVVLSSNMKRMLKDHVLVRKLVGIETSGSLNLLFTDKTGTLTKGKLQVGYVIAGDGNLLKPQEAEQETEPETKPETETGIKPGTEIKSKTKLRSAAKTKSGYEELKRLLALSGLYNTASTLSKDQVIGGNATDRALMEYILPLLHDEKINLHYETDHFIPFDSAYKFSAVQVKAEKPLVLVKGAPELLLPNCSSYYDSKGHKKELLDRKKIEMLWQERTGKAERVLALATSPTVISQKGSIHNLCLIGLICIRDEVRPDARDAVMEIEQAGIQVVMVTGDNKETARAIGKKVGLLNQNNEDKSFSVITSQQLAQMSDREVKDALGDLRVVARALPSDKSRLVNIAQEKGLVTGMTGDGINDAPALKIADIGFAMGTGTEVAKEAGDIVIMNNNIRSISKAVLYGRTVFKSIRKFIVFQLTMNLCALGVSFIGPFIGIDTPVTVIQMLWINMIMDTLGGLAFSGEAPLQEYMNEPPKRRDEAILNRYMINQVALTGGFTMILCIVFLTVNPIREIFEYNVTTIYFLTGFFALFIFCGVFNSFNARTQRLNLLANISKNKAFIAIMGMIVIVQLVIIYYGGTLFRTVGLPFSKLLFVILMASLVMPFDMLRKCLVKRKGKDTF